MLQLTSHDPQIGAGAAGGLDNRYYYHGTTVSAEEVITVPSKIGRELGVLITIFFLSSETATARLRGRVMSTMTLRLIVYQC